MSNKLLEKPSKSDLLYILKNDIVPLLNMYAPKYKILDIDYSKCLVTFRITRKFWREYGPGFFQSVDDDGLWPIKKKNIFYLFRAELL